MKLSSPCGDKLQCLVFSIRSPPLSYRPLAGISCNPFVKYALTGDVYGYRPLAGISCNRCKLCGEPIDVKLSSPCGDKLQCLVFSIRSPPLSYRPLAGISCNPFVKYALTGDVYGYRPLAGISCNQNVPGYSVRPGLSSPCGDKLQSRISFSACSMRSRLSSPCGDKLQSGRLNRCIAACGYRPLAGISCNSRTAPKRNSFPAFFKACSAITR